VDRAWVALRSFHALAGAIVDESSEAGALVAIGRVGDAISAGIGVVAAREAGHARATGRGTVVPHIADALVNRVGAAVEGVAVDRAGVALRSFHALACAVVDESSEASTLVAIGRVGDAISAGIGVVAAREAGHARITGRGTVVPHIADALVDRIGAAVEGVAVDRAGVALRSFHALAGAVVDESSEASTLVAISRVGDAISAGIGVVAAREAGHARATGRGTVVPHIADALVDRIGAAVDERVAVDRAGVALRSFHALAGAVVDESSEAGALVAIGRVDDAISTGIGIVQAREAGHALVAGHGTEVPRVADALVDRVGTAIEGSAMDRTWEAHRSASRANLTARTHTAFTIVTMEKTGTDIIVSVFMASKAAQSRRNVRLVATAHQLSRAILRGPIMVFVLVLVATNKGSVAKVVALAAISWF
jgi:hypothetical protein